MQISGYGNKANFNNNHQKPKMAFGSVEVDYSRALEDLKPPSHEYYFRNDGNQLPHYGPIQSKCTKSNLEQYANEIKEKCAGIKETIKVAFIQLKELNAPGEHVLGNVEVNNNGNIVKEPFVGMPAAIHGNGEPKEASVAREACAAIERAMVKAKKLVK